MLKIRKSAERGEAEHGWLHSHFSFSFSGYHDPRHMGFRSLRVMNEDWIQPGQGFGMHGHNDMEIVTYVLSGQLKHQDSLGTSAVLHAGEFQHMTAGTGVRHSEFNPSDTEPVHLYQIWLLPNQDGLPPSYEDRVFSDKEKQGRLRVVASSDGRDDSLTIHQDASIYLAELKPNDEVVHRLAEGRHAWLQVLSGTLSLNDFELAEGDGVAVSEQTELKIAAASPAEIMLFDLA